MGSNKIPPLKNNWIDIDYVKTSTPTLYAFGCSYTYGQGLEDCNGKPSKSSYVSILGRHANRTVRNLSFPGSSNKEILYTLKLVQEHFKPNDLIIFQWTYINRTMMISKDGNLDRWGTDFDPERRIDRLGAWIKSKRAKSYYQKVWSPDDDPHTTSWYINYAELSLRKQGIKNILHFQPPGLDNPEAKLISDLLEPDIEYCKYNITDYYVDKAQDGQHPGLNSQRDFASALIKDYPKMFSVTRSV